MCRPWKKYSVYFIPWRFCFNVKVQENLHRFQAINEIFHGLCIGQTFADESLHHVFHCMADGWNMFPWSTYRKRWLVQPVLFRGTANKKKLYYSTTTLSLKCTLCIHIRASNFVAMCLVLYYYSLCSAEIYQSICRSCAFPVHFVQISSPVLSTWVDSCLHSALIQHVNQPQCIFLCCSSWSWNARRLSKSCTFSVPILQKSVEVTVSVCAIDYLSMLAIIPSFKTTFDCYCITLHILLCCQCSTLLSNN